MSGVLIVGSVAFLFTGALVPLLARFAAGRNLLDVPNLRSSHEIPTPRLGGVAIILGSWVGALMLGPGDAAPLLTAATLIGAVGLLDDLGDLHFGIKAVAQTLAAAALIFFHAPPLLSEAPGLLKLLVFVVGVFWIVALTNAFNFMDGIDGIIGGVALVNVAFLAALAVPTAGGVLPALAGAVAGFLIWNINPASIFLGDSGSYFLGFFLAATALYAPLPGTGWNPVLFFAGILVFAPLLFDTAYTLVRRFVAGKNVFSAHREHVYQRITPTTGLHRRTSNLYYGASAIAGLAALLVAGGGAFAGTGILLTLSCCAGLAALPLVFKTEN